MKKNNYNVYAIDDEKEQNLFKQAIIVFDTSALLDFYYYSENARNEIFKKLFTKLIGRLWITSQTEFEFLKNREIVLKKPIDTYENLSRKTKNPDSGHIDELRKKLDELKTIIAKDMQGQLKTLTQKTSKNEKHPYIDKSVFSKFEKKIILLEEQVSEFTSFFDEFRTSFENEVKQRKDQLEASVMNDEILTQFECFFKTTKPFSYIETLQIIAEGEIRYRNSIPPGYMDDEEKTGFPKYGDLIIWKEIIQNFALEKKDIVLVTNDKKEDWWRISDKNHSEGPRHELIKEIYDATGRFFWMYDMNQFLFKSKKYLQTEIEEETIENVTQTIIDMEESSNVIYQTPKSTETLDSLKLIYTEIVEFINAIESDEEYVFIEGNIETPIKHFNAVFRKDYFGTPEWPLYFPYLSRFSRYLTDIGSYNYTIIYQEYRMKKDTETERIKMIALCKEFINLYEKFKKII